MPTSTLKSCVVGVRLSAGQYALFGPAIQDSGLKPAGFFRQLVLSRSPKMTHSPLDLDRLGQCFAMASQTLNTLAHEANAAPYKGALYESHFVAWLKRLVSIRNLIYLALPETSPPTRITYAAVKSTVGEQSICINFRLTPEELEPFLEMMEKAHCSRSTFFRELILKGEPEFKTYTGLRKQLVFLYNKSANNTGQLARVASAAFERGLIEEPLLARWHLSLTDIKRILLMGIEYAD